MDLISSIAGLIVTVGGFLAGLFTGKRIRNAQAREQEAQAKTIELSNVVSEIAIYKNMIVDLKGHNEQLQKMYSDLISNVEPLRSRVSHLEDQVYRLEQENARLKNGHKPKTP